MFNEDIAYCQSRIAEEEELADGASSPEAGLIHAQMAMLYKSQLAILLCRSQQSLDRAA